MPNYFDFVVSGMEWMPSRIRSDDWQRGKGGKAKADETSVCRVWKVKERIIQIWVSHVNDIAMSNSRLSQETR